jgi:polysaccharide export outer membrane protein
MARFTPTLLIAATMLGGCAGGGGYDYARDYHGRPAYGAPAYGGTFAPFANIGFATWQEDEPEYRLYPGDTMDISVLSAPELNRTVTVQPDGRITMPLVPPIMAADRSVTQLQHALSQAYASQLVRPDISVAVKSTTSLKVFVGGWVDKPGVYDMPGDIDAMQAIIMAGGYKIGARSDSVVILRRGPNGRAMMRTADLRGATRGHFVVQQVPLRRFDVIYVPKTSLEEIAGFVSQVRDALPVQFSYVIGGQYVTTR